MDLDEELAAKKRVTLPPRDDHDLTRETLGTPMADVLIVLPATALVSEGASQ